MPVPIITGNLAPRGEVALASAARTATTSSTPSPNKDGWRGGMAILDCTVWGSNFTLSINAIDPVTGKAVALLTSANITQTGTTVYEVHPLITASANLKANMTLGDKISVTVTASDATSNTYSVGWVWLP